MTLLRRAMNIYFYSELFNLPIGALWTAVVGEWELDSGGRGSARLPIERVILHERFNNYVDDIGKRPFTRNLFTRERIIYLFS